LIYAWKIAEALQKSKSIIKYSKWSYRMRKAVFPSSLLAMRSLWKTFRISSLIKSVTSHSWFYSWFLRSMRWDNDSWLSFDLARDNRHTDEDCYRASWRIILTNRMRMWTSVWISSWDIFWYISWEPWTRVSKDDIWDHKRVCCHSSMRCDDLWDCNAMARCLLLSRKTRQ